tara:strand:- start:368 stop:892 length:525 start_codon:yes stop_codon:yes gene_type:complete
MSIKTIFLDRDGVINQEINYLHQISDFKFVSGTFDACRDFQKKGYHIVIVTNQSGIERGIYTENDYQILTQWMLEQFIRNKIKILDVLHCPHGPESKCECRKPKPGLLIKAKNLHNIDMHNSWMIGDKESDIQAAKNSDVGKTILVRSGHSINELKTDAKYIVDSIKQSKGLIN